MTVKDILNKISLVAITEVWQPYNTEVKLKEYHQHFDKSNANNRISGGVGSRNTSALKVM